MGLNCNIDREKHKYNSKIPTAHLSKMTGVEIQTRDIHNPHDYLDLHRRKMPVLILLHAHFMS